jgi:membrane fusion protein, multidrug efflux system
VGAQEPTTADQSDPVEPAPNGGRRRRRVLILMVLLAALAVGGTLWWLHGLGEETTDNAFIEGDTQTIASEITGRVEAVHLVQGAEVRQGDLLVEVESADAEARVAESEAALVKARATVAKADADLAYSRADTTARLAEAEAAHDLAESELAQRHADVAAAQAEFEQAAADANRYQVLSQSDFASRQRVETAQARRRTTEARLAAARSAVAAGFAEVRRAEAAIATARAAQREIAAREADLAAAGAAVRQSEASLRAALVALDHTRIIAAHDGVVSRKSVVPGQMVQPGQALAALVFGKPWVVANFKETQLTRIRPGQPVTIEVDAYPGLVLRGRIDSIGRGTGAYFSLLPPENATGNFVEVVQRIPVKITINDGFDPLRPLSLGMSVVPVVHVDQTPG